METQIRLCVSIVTLPTKTYISIYIVASEFKLSLSKIVMNNSFNWHGI